MITFRGLASRVRFSGVVGLAGPLYETDNGAFTADLELGFPSPSGL